MGNGVGVMEANPVRQFSEASEARPENCNFASGPPRRKVILPQPNPAKEKGAPKSAL
jgi:hypothetical protein